jgi:hypothetical protein
MALKGTVSAAELCLVQDHDLRAEFGTLTCSKRQVRRRWVFAVRRRRRLQRHASSRNLRCSKVWCA